MQVLLAIALKSLLIAGLTLGLLALLKKRSAAERSWVAHIGLLALVIMAFAPLVLPSWNVEAPALLGQAPAPEAAVQAPSSTAAKVTMRPASPPAVEAPARATLSAAAAATAAYAVPAAILLFITLLALARLIALRARAEVLVDGHWLSALARAQRRMGFKHGTALLTSNELASPISWGLMRPVILLNNRAVEASGEAEAIIAHELAHVARMDWAKLLLARVATALFWFNPLVWVLAREAHQLREEAADDAVLAADINDTDYAQLLVGVARHECPGLLLGAHGVAPSKSSLARRVARVLDATSVRGPAARSFAAGVFVGAIMVAAPLAALTLTPGGASKETKPAANTATKVDTSKPYYAAPEVPADLPHIIASGVSTSVSTAMAAVAAPDREDAVADALDAARDAREDALNAARDARENALERVRDAQDNARERARAQALSRSHIDRIIEMHAAGVDADYVNSLRAAQPRLMVVDPANFVGMKSVGVTPQFARDLAAAGFRNLDANQLTEARAVGMTGEYARAMAAAGIPPRLDDYVQLRAVGVSPAYVLKIRKSGHSVADADKIVEMWAVGVRPEDLRVGPVAPPRPPTAPRPPRAGHPAASPPAGDADDDGG
jgi:beta-lactamase regulating signal transducer with metallopeptidase domain